MRLSRPTTPVFLLALTLTLLGTVGRFEPLPVISEHAFFFVLGGAVLLLLGCLFRGI